MQPYRHILVTGGTALVGSALQSIQLQYPESTFQFVGSRDCNLTDLNHTVNFIEKQRPDAIIHLAALNLGIGSRINYPATILRSNILMNFNILEAAKRSHVQKVIMTLSTGMYPEQVPIPIRENYIHDGPPHESNYGYAFAKRLVEPSIRAYRSEHGLNVIGVVLNWIFGEHDNYCLEDAGVLPALIHRFYEHRSDKENLTVWGDGTPLREYTYAKDIAKAYMWCLHHYNEAPILNIGTNEEHSIREIAFMIADILHISTDRITFDATKQRSVQRRSTDNSQFVNLSNFQYTPFKQGLQQTIEWFSATYQQTPDVLKISKKTVMT